MVAGTLYVTILIIALLFCPGGRENARTFAAAFQETPHFRAGGTHQCQSSTSIGHKCKVEGEFHDCDEAYRKLKMEDCCGNTKEGGGSIGFTLDYCSPL